MPTIDVNDTTLYYERSGDGPTLLFVHGMCGDANVWADQAERLQDRYTCVRYDRRGHSRSERGDAPISAALHADDAAALIEALNLAPCLYVGSSGGAAIGVDVTCRYPHLLRGAALSEPPLFSVYPDAAAAAMRDLGPVIERVMATGDERRFVDEFFAAMCPGLWSTIDETRKDRYRANGTIGLDDLRGPSAPTTEADVAAISVPMLVIAGDSSHESLRTIARRLSAAAPDTRFVELERCGHVTYAEQPEAFEHAVSVFASELDRRNPATVAHQA